MNVNAGAQRSIYVDFELQFTMMQNADLDRGSEQYELATPRLLR